MWFEISESVLSDFHPAKCGTPLLKLVHRLCECNLNKVLQTPELSIFPFIVSQI